MIFHFNFDIIFLGDIMAKIMENIFKYIYIAFSFVLVICGVLYFRFSSRKLIILCSILLMSLLFIIFNKKKINISKKVFLVLIGVSLICRFVLLFIPFGEVAGDAYFFYSNASDYALGNGINNSYIALFPYLYSYVILLGKVMLLLGTKYRVVILTNLLIELIGAFFISRIFKNKFSENGYYKATLFYMFNPLSFLWVTKSLPVVIVNTTIILVFYLYEKMVSSESLKNKTIYAILLGMMMSISNLFRPIMIIFVITLLIMAIINLVKNF